MSSYIVPVRGRLERVHAMSATQAKMVQRTLENAPLNDMSPAAIAARQANIAYRKHNTRRCACA